MPLFFELTIHSISLVSCSWAPCAVGPHAPLPLAAAVRRAWDLGLPTMMAASAACRDRRVKGGAARRVQFRLEGGKETGGGGGQGRVCWGINHLSGDNAADDVVACWGGRRRAWRGIKA